jgi:hypothetical protein
MDTTFFFFLASILARHSLQHQRGLPLVGFNPPPSIGLKKLQWAQYLRS